MTNEEMRNLSGNVKDNRKLVSFLYMIMRDHITPGDIETVVSEIEECAKDLQFDKSKDSRFVFTNGWLAQYAKNLADRLEDKE